VCRDYHQNLFSKICFSAVVIVSVTVAAALVVGGRRWGRGTREGGGRL